MKGIIIVLSCFFCSVGFSQDDLLQEFEEDKSDKKQEQEDRLLIDLNHDNWMNVPGGVKVQWFSRGINISLMYDAPIDKSNFSFAVGGSFSSHNIFINSRLVEFEDSSRFQSFLPEENVKRHKLSTNFVDLPIEIRFRTKPFKNGNRLKYAIGGKVGYLLDVHSKTIDNEGKHKFFNFESFAQIRYGVLARVGYGRVGLFGFYSLTQLFEPGIDAPSITPVSVGISILPF